MPHQTDSPDAVVPLIEYVLPHSASYFGRLTVYHMETTERVPMV